MLRLRERRRHKIQLSVSFLLLCITCISGSAPFVHAGESQYGRSVSTSVTSPSQEDVESLKRMAEQGDAGTQYNLGVMYYMGDGVPQNYPEALKWFRKAAEQGNAFAVIYIAVMYTNGEGVEQNYQEARKWLRMAAEQGFAFAQLLLGDIYMIGEGVSQDYQEAKKWLTKAADQGLARAQFELGLIYFYEQHYEEAVKWVRKAAEQGHAQAQSNLGLMYSLGQVIPQDYAEALKWKRKAAEQGFAEAQFNLALMYSNGEGVSQDYVESLKWYRKAAEQGFAEAQFNLGVMYYLGQGVPQDYIYAYFWLNLAATENKDAAIARNQLANSMTPEQIAEAQRLSSDFVARTERAVSGDSDTELSPDTTAFSGNVPTGNGTAFAITRSGYLLTSAHVVQGASRIELYGNGNTHNAQVIKADTANDIALLKAEGTFTALPIASSGGTTLGTEVFTIGFPNVVVQGIAPKLTKGEISSLGGVQDDPRYFQISTPVQPGNSGGPLVAMQGKVIGIIAAIMNQEVALETTGTLAQNVNYAVKSSYILPLLEAVPGLSDEVTANGKSISLSTEEAIAGAEEATFLLVTY